MKEERRNGTRGSSPSFPQKGTLREGKQQELGKGSPRGGSDQDNRDDETANPAAVLANLSQSWFPGLGALSDSSCSRWVGNKAQAALDSPEFCHTKLTIFRLIHSAGWFSSPKWVGAGAVATTNTHPWQSANRSIPPRLLAALSTLPQGAPAVPRAAFTGPSLFWLTFF